MTINELLVLMKTVRERLNGLKSIRSQVATEERTIYGMSSEREKIVTPKYDAVVVDKKITELEIWLFRADAAIKQSNARTEVAINADIDKLLESLS